MSYTEEEILDLEEALSTAGLEEKTSFGILSPEGFEGKFSSAVIKKHGRELISKGLVLKESMLSWKFDGGERFSPVNVLTIQGPRIRAHKEALRIGELYNCTQIVEFVEP